MLLKHHSQLSDLEFEQLFESYQLKPRLFSHEAHVRLAYIHLEKYGLEQAERNMCDQIRGFAASLGDEEKFNKTVTIASVKTIHHFMQKSTASNFDDFIAEYPRLVTNFRDLLAQHYGFDVFRNKQAKKEYLEPYLIPFT